MEVLSKYRKLLLIIGFLAVVGVIGYLIWRLFFAPAEINNIEPKTEAGIGGLFPSGEGGASIATSSTGGNLPESGGLNGETGGNSNVNNTPDGNVASDKATGGLTKTTTVVDAATSGATMTSGGQLQYYNKEDGKFYRLGEDGELIAMSDKVFHKVQNITWSADGKKAILEYPDGSKINYDFSSGKQITLPKHWEDFSFNPGGSQISAKSMADDVENRALIVANADGSKAYSLSAIGNNDKDVYPVWSPNNQAAAMYTKGVDFNRQEVFFVGLNGENFKSTIINGRGFEPSWSSSGDKLLYSVYSSDNALNPKLWIVNAQGDSIGQNRTDLGLNTWASKCSFADNSTVYCAVPVNLTEGSGLFPELAAQTSDNLYKIDLATGAKKLIAVPESANNISGIMVGKEQDKLYFTDGTDGKIYSINLQ